MFDLHHRFLDDFTHVVLSPLKLGPGALAALPPAASPIAMVPSGMERRANLMPLLLPLDSLDRAGRVGLIEAALRWQHEYQRPYFCACLVSRRSTDRLVHHLAAMQRAEVPGAGRFLLRVTDPNVFTRLLDILDEAQLDAVMGPVEQWHWIDPLGQQRRRDCEQDPYLPLRIRPAQLDPLRRTGMVQGCLQMLARAGRRGDAVLLGQQLDAALAEALHRHGLHDEADRRLFAVQALAIRGGPQHHPLLKTALERAAAGQISYVGACAELTDDPLGIPAQESSPDRSWEQAT